MKQFRMKGKAITGVMRYREFFSPEELLEQYELAAGFLYQHFRFLSDAMMYHAEMFYQAAFHWNDEIMPSSPEEYCGVLYCIRHGMSYGRRDYLDSCLQLPDRKYSRYVLWDVANGTDLSKDEKIRLFCMLEAGYAMAGKTPKDCPITPQQAKDAYLHQVKRHIDDQKEWLEFSEEGDIELNARIDPYRILLCQDSGILTEGKKIVCRRIIARPSSQGSTDNPVKLLICLSQDDPNPQEIEFMPGDYRYANFVGSRPVFFHPTFVDTPVCKGERLGEYLYFKEKGKYGQSKKFILKNSDLKIIGIAPQHTDFGWIILSNRGVNYTGYTHCSTDGNRLPNEHIVQVEFRGAECLLLDDNGIVHSNEHGVSSQRVTSLEHYKRQEGNEL